MTDVRALADLPKLPEGATLILPSDEPAPSEHADWCVGGHDGLCNPDDPARKAYY